MIVLASWLHNESANIISGMSIFIIFLLFVVKVQIFDLEVYIYAWYLIKVALECR